MAKYHGQFSDSCSVIDVICDNIIDFRRELAMLRRLKASSEKSINPIIEFDYEGDGVDLGYEFRRLYNASSIRVILRGD